MPPRIYLETEKHPLPPCQEIDFGRSCQGDNCKGCIAAYDELVEEVSDEIDKKYDDTNYRVFDIHELDREDGFSTFWVELKWFKNP